MSGSRLTDGDEGPGASPPPVSARLIPFSDCPPELSGTRGPLGCRGRKLQRPLIQGEEFDAIGLRITMKKCHSAPERKLQGFRSVLLISRSFSGAFTVCFAYRE